MDVTLSWQGKLSFTGVGNSGFVQKLDASESVGGDDSAANPMEYLALGLGGCTGMDVISILRKKKQAVTNFQIKVRAERAKEHPKVFTKAIIEYLVTGKDIQEAAVVRAIQLSAEKYCPAQAMLIKAFPIKMTYKIFDEDGKTLLKDGEYLLKSSAV